MLSLQGFTSIILLSFRSSGAQTQLNHSLNILPTPQENLLLICVCLTHTHAHTLHFFNTKAHTHTHSLTNRTLLCARSWTDRCVQLHCRQRKEGPTTVAGHTNTHTHNQIKELLSVHLLHHSQLTFTYCVSQTTTTIKKTPRLNFGSVSEPGEEWDDISVCMSGQRQVRGGGGQGRVEGGRATGVGGYTLSPPGCSATATQRHSHHQPF